MSSSHLILRALHFPQPYLDFRCALRVRGLGPPLSALFSGPELSSIVLKLTVQTWGPERKDVLRCGIL